jgi:hypothetical protein
MCTSIKEVLKMKQFWKFVTLMFLLVGVRMILVHLNMTFPKYLMRQYGEDVLYGSIILINPFMVIIFVIFL